MKMIWNFSGITCTKVLKTYFGFYKIEFDKQIFIQEINVLIRSIKCLKQMFNNIKKYALKRFY